MRIHDQNSFRVEHSRLCRALKHLFRDGGRRYPALVLNADYTPLSYVPLSLWSWQNTVRAVFREAVTVIAEYDVMVSSPSMSMMLPSVIVLKKYVGRNDKGTPCFTRRKCVCSGANRNLLASPEAALLRDTRAACLPVQPLPT